MKQGISALLIRHSIFHSLSPLPCAFSSTIIRMGGKPEPSRRIPSFFKIMIDDFSEQLKIPPAFAKHFDGVFPQKVVLRSTAGRVGRVNVKKVGNKLSFGEGWRLFVQDNSLEFGDFLVFRYAENSEFIVTIYGKNACEKDVALATRNNNDIIYIDSDCTSTDETSMSSPQDQCRCKEFQPPHHDNSKKLTREGSAGSSVRPVTEKPSCSRVPMATQGKARALEAASKFVSEHPFFKVVMTQSHLRRSPLYIPKGFSKSYIMKGSQSTTLQVSDRLWPVKLNTDSTYAVRISAGLGAFVKDNNLREGDACVFELIKRNDMVLKVSIFRCTD